MSIETLHAILRSNLSSFIHKTFNTINPGMRYLSNWHIDLIADYLENTSNGNIKRLIINMPPRALKSVCVSVAWPAWLLGQDSTKRILVASYSQMLGIKHSMDTRFVITSDWYKQIFPKTIISPKHNQKSKFMTTNHGFRFATSVGGSVTGEGGDILIIDDPHNPTHIHSSKMRIKAIDWFEQTFSTRLNNRATGAIVLVMQRLHEDDLSGHLINSAPDSWEVLKIPAICSEDKKFIVNGVQIELKEGDMLHSARDEKDTLLKLEQEIGVHNFAAQYLQEPISKSSSLLNLEDICFVSEMPQNFEYYVQSWDTAIKITEDSDYSVCTIWGVIQSTYYLLDIFRKRMAYPELKNAAEKLRTQYNPRLILIEDKASGQSLIQDLRICGVMNIVPIKPKLDKVTRFAAVVPLFQAGRVILPKEARWMQHFLKEVTAFPAGKHDDIVDSISQFLGYTKTTPKDHRIREI
ncbi:MAG: phage terminase large subunit [Pseudomonadota bacterium]